jgi:hypothetical protein
VEMGNTEQPEPTHGAFCATPASLCFPRCFGPEFLHQELAERSPLSGRKLL